MLQMTRGARGLAVASIALLSGCAWIEYLPFLKRPVDTAPHGARSTVHGPAFAESVAPAARGGAPHSDWTTYNNTFTGQRYSPLAQITAANVASLRPVCAYATGERVPMESGPVVVGGVLYATTATTTYALDAATCRLRWKHTYAYSPHPDFDLKVNRGVAYLDTPDGPRLFRGANDGRVYALDARTGEERWNVLAGDVRRGETFPAAPVAWRGGDHDPVEHHRAADVRRHAILPRRAGRCRVERAGVLARDESAVRRLRRLVHDRAGRAGEEAQEQARHPVDRERQARGAVRQDGPARPAQEVEEEIAIHASIGANVVIAATKLVVTSISGGAAELTHRRVV